MDIDERNHRNADWIKLDQYGNRRLSNLQELRIHDGLRKMNDARIKIAANAATSGHDLSSFETVEDQGVYSNGLQAMCRRCHQTAWVSLSGWVYSQLSDRCPGELVTGSQQLRIGERFEGDSWQLAMEILKSIDGYIYRYPQTKSTAVIEAVNIVRVATAESV